MNECENSKKDKENDHIKIKIPELNQNDFDKFENDGILIFDNVIPDAKQVNQLLERTKGCYYYKFDQSITPDEMTWRPNVCRDDVTREIINLWKTDSVMAQLVLNEELGKFAATMLQCDSVRIGQDNSFWKPCNAKSIGMHQDQPYLGCFLPNKVLTVWIALTDVSKENGTLELVKGSHKWDKHLLPEENPSFSSMEFHAPTNYKRGMIAAANKQGFKNLGELDIHHVTVKAGGMSVHHGMVWHGSNSNPSTTQDRLSVAIHFIPGDAVYNPNVKAAFAFGRYKLFGSNKLDETFYPITYSKDGYKSPIINYIMNNKDHNYMSLLD